MLGLYFTADVLSVPAVMLGGRSSLTYHILLEYAEKLCNISITNILYTNVFTAKSGINPSGNL